MHQNQRRTNTQRGRRGRGLSIPQNRRRRRRPPTSLMHMVIINNQWCIKYTDRKWFCFCTQSHNYWSYHHWTGSWSVTLVQFLYQQLLRESLLLVYVSEIMGCVVSVWNKDDGQRRRFPACLVADSALFQFSVTAFKGLNRWAGSDLEARSQCPFSRVEEVSGEREGALMEDAQVCLHLYLQVWKWHGHSLNIQTWREKKIKPSVCGFKGQS